MTEYLAAATSVAAVLAALVAVVLITQRRTSSLSAPGLMPELKPSVDQISGDQGESSMRAVAPSGTSLRHYQYVAKQKIDRLYEQVVEAGLRPVTNTSQIGAAGIVQARESIGPPAALTTVQKLEVLRHELVTVDIDSDEISRTETGTHVVAHGTMLMKHAVLPVFHHDESPTQAVWIGRLTSGRFVCLGGSAANVNEDVPRGHYLNSGVAHLLQAIHTASREAAVPFQRDVRSRHRDSPEPLHDFPGAWDAEVADIWTHARDLHTHKVRFLAQLMTSAMLELDNPMYDVVVGTPISVEFAE